MVRGWAATPENNFGLLLRAGETESLGSLVRFISSDAFRCRSDGYGGGTRIAQRPVLVVLPGK